MQSDWVLVVDDEPGIRRALVRLLQQGGFRAHAAESAEAALELIDDEPPAVAFIDIVLPGVNGLELLHRLERQSPMTECVMMTSHVSVDTALQAIRDGAFDFLEKPFDDLQEICAVAQRAQEKRDLSLANRSLLLERGSHNLALARSLDRLKAVDTISRKMSELLSTAELLQFFIVTIADELGVGRATLMLLDQHAGVLRIAAHHGTFDFDPGEVSVALGEGIAGSVAARGEPALVREPNGGADAPIVLSVPLCSNRRTLGVVNLTDRVDGASFTDEDQHFVLALSSHLAVDIERTRHVEALESANDSLRETREQLVFAERLKATGQLAAGVAHDFNNTLSVMLARSQMIAQRIDAGDPDWQLIRRDAAAITDAALAGAETIRRLQDYTRIRRDAPLAAVDLNEVIDNAVSMTEPRWRDEAAAQGRSFEIVREFGDVRPIAGNFHELTQVVGNLIFNALDAMPRGGELRFRTLRELDRTVLYVSDTGMGMDDEVRSKIFQPFFTTKDSGQGLGTSIVYGIVSRHGGAIAVHSEPGSGTTFRLDFPVTEMAVPVESPEQASRSLSSVSRVLLCDDDDLVREVFEEALISGGHEVVTAANGDEAIARIAESTFDLVVTDLSMPGKSGFDVARAVKSTLAGVPVVLLSGWAVQHDDHEVREAGIDRVLVKPCPIDELLETVAEMSAAVTEETAEVCQTPPASKR